MDEKLFRLLCQAVELVVPPLRLTLDGVARRFELVAGSSERQELLIFLHGGEREQRDEVARRAEEEAEPQVHLFLPISEEERKLLPQLRKAFAVAEGAGPPSLFEATPAQRAQEALRRHLMERGRRAELFWGSESGPATALPKFQQLAVAQRYPRFVTGGSEGVSGSHKTAPEMVRDWLGASTWSGGEIRSHFLAPPFGWAEETVCAALTALAEAGEVLVEQNGRSCLSREIQPRNWRRLSFQGGMTALTSRQRQQLRRLYDSCGVQVEERGEEAAFARLVPQLHTLAAAAGGAPPRPAPPEAPLVAELEQLQGLPGVLQLLQRGAELETLVETWRQRAETIAARLPLWEEVSLLVENARTLSAADSLCWQADAWRRQRGLLESGAETLLQSLREGLTELLVMEVQRLEQRWLTLRNSGEEQLKASLAWQGISAEEKNRLRHRHGLLPKRSPRFSLAEGVVALLKCNELSSLQSALALLPDNYRDACLDAEIAAQDALSFVEVPPSLIRNEQELTQWLAERESELRAALADGVVLVNHREV